MTGEEFLDNCAAPLETAYGSIDATTMRMYRTFLEDFSPEVLGAAVAKCIAESKWLPKISEIRLAAVEVVRGTFHETSPAEAWGVAWNAAGSIDFDIDGSLERVAAKTPPLIWEAMRATGLRHIAYAEGPSVIHWKKTFEEVYASIVARQRKELLAPPHVRRAIEQHSELAKLSPSAAGNVAGALKLIGAET